MKRVVAMDHAHLYVKITTAPWANLHSELKVTPGDGTLKIKDENRDMLPHDGISAFALLISPHGLHKTIGTAPDPRRCGMAQSGCSAAIGALFFPPMGHQPRMWTTPFFSKHRRSPYVCMCARCQIPKHDG